MSVTDVAKCSCDIMQVQIESEVTHRAHYQINNGTWLSDGEQQTDSSLVFLVCFVFFSKVNVPRVFFFFLH